MEASNARADGAPRVCVTGASGFIAAFIVRDLLRAGFAVNGTVRSLKNEKKITPLHSIAASEKATARLRLFEGDLSSVREGGGFAKALAGCQALVHAATPILHGSKMDEKEAMKLQVSPAVDSALEILKLAHEAGVRSVVLTSSMGAVKGRTDVAAAKTSIHLTRDTWSDPKHCVAQGQWYRYAKTKQEQAARDFCAGKGIGFMSINPDFVLGPTLTPHFNFSHMVFVREFLTAANAEKLNLSGSDGYMGAVDVEDVSLAHVQALQRLMKPNSAVGDSKSSPNAYRFVMSAGYMHKADLIRLIRQRFPWVSTPTPCQNPTKVPPTIDNGPVEALLGRKLAGFDVVVTATVNDLLRNGHIRKATKE